MDCPLSPKFGGRTSKFDRRANFYATNATIAYALAHTKIISPHERHTTYRKNEIKLEQPRDHNQRHNDKKTIDDALPQALGDATMTTSAADDSFAHALLSPQTSVVSSEPSALLDDSWTALSDLDGLRALCLDAMSTKERDRMSRHKSRGEVCFRHGWSLSSSSSSDDDDTAVRRSNARVTHASRAACRVGGRRRR